MKSPRRRRKSVPIPVVTPLEPRRLLSASVVSLGQSGVDLVGPDASQGSDGIQDLHLQISGLAGPVASVSVQATGGFAWATAPDTSGYALAEYFPSTTSGQGDLYINPRIRRDQSATGGTLPLGGSTGPLIQLTNGDTLTVTIDYSNNTTPEVVKVPVAGLVSATDPMPATPTPANVLGTFQVQDLGQDDTGHWYEQGYVHLVVTAPAGVSFSSTTFGQITWTLTDHLANYWDSTASTLGHNHIDATLRSGSTNVADLYFPPAANEAPATGSSTPTMMLQAALPGNPQVYATPFSGIDPNFTLMTAPINTQAAPPPPTTEAQLRADLMSTSPEYDTINLPANQTIVITQPLQITHSLRIVGNGATLLFQQGNTAAWPSSASGAIDVNNPGGNNIQLDFQNFTVRFDMSQPIRWSNPSGVAPTLWDPENNAGITHAVLDLRGANSNMNREDVTLSGVSIYGPPAFNGASFSALQSQLTKSGDTGHRYVGEQAIDLILSNDSDTGSITGGTFQGGPIEVSGGPWTIANNNVLGAQADTYSPAAFELHSMSGAQVLNNNVTQSDPAGSEFRLVVLAVGGFGDTIAGNHFGGGAGWTGDEVTYDSGPGQFAGINDPEVILAESSNTVLFEGRPSAVSADGRLLVLSGLRAPATTGWTGPGMVVSILAGVNADGSPNMALAGTYYRVSQQAGLSGDSITLLMLDAMPAPPPGGHFIVEVTSGFVNNTISGNTLDLTGKSSTSIMLDGEQYGTQILNNTFIGGTIYDNGYSGTAILIGATTASVPTSGVPFPLPPAWTPLPNLGSVIEGNTIRDSLGGIRLMVEHVVDYWAARIGTVSDTGRVYISSTITGNTFQFDTSFLNSWASHYVAQGNDPSQVETPPTITLGSGWSSEAPTDQAAPRFPWTVGNAITLFGSDTSIFVDPAELSVTLSDNTTQSIAADGTTTTETGSTGQVYAATVNGQALAPRLAARTFNGLPYYAFNLQNLDISVAGPSSPSPTPTPTPSPSPSPTPTPTPSPSPSPTPTPTPSPSPSPTDPPALSPASPTNLNAVAIGPAQVNLSWSASTGATGYVVERMASGGIWQLIARGVPSTSYVDTGLSAGTTYQYAVVATNGSAFSGLSAPSAVTTPAVSASTAPESLTIQPSVIGMARRRVFRGTVATFADTNAQLSSGRFAALIQWGDGRTSVGRITGAGGRFSVFGRHRFRRPGQYAITVDVTLSNPSGATSHTSATTTAAIGRPMHARRHPGRFGTALFRRSHHHHHRGR